MSDPRLSNLAAQAPYERGGPARRERRPCTSRRVRSYGAGMGHLAPPTTGRRVGEISRAAGLTVRTLHYYDEIGLLSPSARSSSGHRLYVDADVERLYRICVLRRLGLPLRDIARAL